MNYSELEKLPPEAYLDPKNFVTENDHLPEKGYAEQQYQTGLREGLRARVVDISVRSIWGTETLTGGSVQSYEGIGYHSCTSDLLRGLIDSGCRIVVHRWTATGINSTRIQEYKPPHPMFEVEKREAEKAMAAEMYIPSWDETRKAILSMCDDK